MHVVAADGGQCPGLLVVLLIKNKIQFQIKTEFEKIKNNNIRDNKFWWSHDAVRQTSDKMQTAVQLLWLILPSNTFPIRVLIIG